MKTNYTEAFKEQAVQKALLRGGKSLKNVANELNISHWTLRGWLKKVAGGELKTKQRASKRPQDWALQERLQGLLESFGLADEALHAYCRERGIFPHHLEQWRKAFSRSEGGKSVRSEQKERNALKAEIQQLKRELNRKEKALAESAALLVLQKKFRAFWEEKGE
jgi:transposase-like protein